MSNEDTDGGQGDMAATERGTLIQYAEAVGIGPTNPITVHTHNVYLGSYNSANGNQQLGTIDVIQERDEARVKVRRADGKQHPIHVEVFSDGQSLGVSGLMESDQDEWTFKDAKIDKTYTFEAKSLKPIENEKTITSGPFRLDGATEDNSLWKFKSEEGAVKITDDLYFNKKKLLRDGYNVYEGMMGGIAPQEIVVKLIPDNEIGKREIRNVVDHHNVIKYFSHGYFEFGKDYLYIAMEKCEKVRLYDIAKDTKFNFDFRKKAMIQLFHGLSHIHAGGILHRDLKPGNVLKLGENMKISDFGLSKKKKEGKSTYTKSSEEIGTEGWGSPESFDGEAGNMTRASDIYSAGLTFFFVLSGGKHPFGDNPQHWKSNILKNQDYSLEVLPKDCLDRELIIDLTEKMLAREPEDRPSADDVLAHPFFWKDERKLEFMCDISDQRPLNVIEDLQKEMKSLGDEGWFEILKIAGEDGGPFYKETENPNNRRKKYKTRSILSLFEYIRNLRHHLDEKPGIKALTPTREAMWRFFASRPFIARLFCETFNLVAKKYREIPGEFHKYFEERVGNVELPLSSS